MASLSRTFAILKAPTNKTAFFRSTSAATTSFFHSTSRTMGVTKTTHKEGSGASPIIGDRVTIEYTCFLKDTTQPDNKGKKCVLLFPPIIF